MACSKNRRIFWIAFSLLILAAIAGLSYYIWYSTYYKYNIADHVHYIKFSKSDYEVKVIWRRTDWQCTAEIYQGRNLQHEIDLGKWFISNERENAVWLESGYGPGMLISVHEDSPNFATTVFCTSYGCNCCTYFNLNNLRWHCGNEEEISRGFPFMTTEVRHTVDRFLDFLDCSNSHTTTTPSDFLPSSH